MKLATAESCTGGLIAAVLTAIAGSSDVVERAFVIHSNAAKMELLGMPAELISTLGAISGPVAERMAEGALQRSLADIVVSVTGLACSGGGSVEKPVGLAWFGLAQRGRTTVAERQIFPGDRTGIRVSTVERAFALIRAQLRPLGQSRQEPSSPRISCHCERSEAISGQLHTLIEIAAHARRLDPGVATLLAMTG